MAGTGAPIKLLAAGDDPVILRLIEVNLSLEGFEVETATEGEDALAKAREVVSDVNLLDVMTPGMTGGEWARRFVAAYVSKPFDPAELVDTIRRPAGRV